MSTPGHGKGSLLIHTRNYVVKTRGQAAWDDVVAQSDPADREILRGVPLAAGWYPIGVVNRAVTRCLERRDQPSPDDEMRKLSAYIADSDLGTVYKMVLRLGSPEQLLRRTDSLWNRYFDVGTLTPHELGRNQWKLTLSSPVGEEAAPNQYFCGPGCPSWIEMGMRLTGAARASVKHTECRYQNGSRCTYVATW